MDALLVYGIENTGILASVSDLHPFNKCYRTFRDRYRGGSDHVRLRPDEAVVVMAKYPPGAMIRANWYKPGAAELADAWLYGSDDIDDFEVPF